MKKFLFIAALFSSFVAHGNSQVEKAMPGGDIINILPTAYDPVGYYVPTDEALNKYFSNLSLPKNFPIPESTEVFLCKKSDTSTILDVFTPYVVQKPPISLPVEVGDKAYLKSFLTGEWAAMLRKSAQVQRYVLRIHIPRLTLMEAETVALEITPIDSTNQQFIGDRDRLVSLRERKRLVTAIRQLDFSLLRAPLFVDQSGGRYLVISPKNLEEVLVHIETTRPQDLVKLEIKALVQPKGLYFLSSGKKILIFIPPVLSKSRITGKLAQLGCEKRLQWTTASDLKVEERPTGLNPWAGNLVSSVTPSLLYFRERLELFKVEFPEFEHLFAQNRSIAEADKTTFQSQPETPVQWRFLVHSAASLLGIVIGLLIPKLSRRKWMVFAGSVMAATIIYSFKIVPDYVAAPLVELLVFVLITTILRKNFHG